MGPAEDGPGCEEAPNGDPWDPEYPAGGPGDAPLGAPEAGEEPASGAERGFPSMAPKMDQLMNVGSIRVLFLRFFFTQSQSNDDIFDKCISTDGYKRKTREGTFLNAVVVS